MCVIALFIFRRETEVLLCALCAFGQFAGVGKHSRVVRCSLYMPGVQLSRVLALQICAIALFILRREVEVLRCVFLGRNFRGCQDRAPPRGRAKSA